MFTNSQATNNVSDRQNAIDALRAGIENGEVKINEQNRNGNTPLHLSACGFSEPSLNSMCVQNPDFQIAEILLAAGADPFIKNNEGKTPAEYIYPLPDSRLSSKLRLGRDELNKKFFELMVKYDSSIACVLFFLEKDLIWPCNIDVTLLSLDCLEALLTWCEKIEKAASKSPDDADYLGKIHPMMTIGKYWMGDTIKNLKKEIKLAKEQPHLISAIEYLADTAHRYTLLRIMFTPEQQALLNLIQQLIGFVENNFNQKWIKICETFVSDYDNYSEMLEVLKAAPSELTKVELKFARHLTLVLESTFSLKIAADTMHRYLTQRGENYDMAMRDLRKPMQERCDLYQAADKINRAPVLQELLKKTENIREGGSYTKRLSLFTVQKTNENEGEAIRLPTHSAVRL